MNYYQLLNNLEGCLWLIAATTIKKIIPIKNKQHNTASNIATIGFLLFAISDFIEANHTREVHLWLWALKISCGIIFLTARIHYIGKANLRWNDRYLIFFLLCTCAASVVMHHAN